MAKVLLRRLLYALTAALALGACSNAITMTGEDVARKFFVEVNPKPENGNLILSGGLEPQSKGIQVYIMPAPGFVYKNGSLGFRNRSQPKDRRLMAITLQNGYYYQFTLPGAHTEVTAEFVPNTAEYLAEGAEPSKNTISIDRDIKNGFIVPDFNLATPGSEIKIYTYPSSGYTVDAGSFEVFEVVNGELNKLAIAVTPESPHIFTTPAEGKDILVKANFIASGFRELAVAAQEYLKDGRYDTAASLYEQAYQKRSQVSSGEDQKLLDEVIFYHSLGKLGTMLIDGRVREFLGSGKNRLNVNGVPATMDDWMCDIASGWPGNDERYWYEPYEGIDYTQDNSANQNRKGYETGVPPLWHPITEKTDKVILPKISAYSGFDRMDTSGQGSGFPGDFGNSPLMNQLEKGRYKYWHVYFMLMLCQCRDEGLNLLLQKVDELLLGNAFEAAASVAATLRPEAEVPLYSNLKDRFRNVNGDSLERYYGPDSVSVGKAELDFIFGMLRLAKASVQYLRSYDWFILGQPWLIDDTTPDNGPDQILHKAFQLAESNDIYSLLWAGSARNDVLPLRGKFLEVRDAGFISKSKNEFIKALQLINTSVTYWFGANFNATTVPSTSNFSQAGFVNYKWAAMGFKHALESLQNDTVFYFPDKLPQPSAASVWPTRAGVASYGINIGTFFTPGVFSLRNLIVSDPRNSRAPAMYRIQWYYEDMVNRNGFAMLPRRAARVTEPIPDDDSGTVASRNIDFMLYTFELNMDNLRAIFPKGFEQNKYNNHYNDSANPDYNPDLAGKRAFLYEVFPTIPIWPERPTYLSGPGNGGNKSAQYLYKYYHDIR